MPQSATSRIDFDRELDREIEAALPGEFKGPRKTRLRAEHMARKGLDTVRREAKNIDAPKSLETD